MTTARPVDLVALLADPAKVAAVDPEEARALLAPMAALCFALTVRAAAAPPASGSVAPEGDPEQLLTLPEVARALAVQDSEAYALARRGKLPSVRIGPKYVRVRRADLNVWIRSRREPPLASGLYSAYSLSRDDDGRGVPANSATARPVASRAGRAHGRGAQHGGPVGTRRAADLGTGGKLPRAPGPDDEDGDPPAR